MSWRSFVLLKYSAVKTENSGFVAWRVAWRTVRNLFRRMLDEQLPTGYDVRRLPRRGEMLAVAGNQEIGPRLLGTFQEAVVRIVARNHINNEVGVYDRAADPQLVSPLRISSAANLNLGYGSTLAYSSITAGDV